MKQALALARHSVSIASPWISRSAVRLLLAALRDDLALRLLLRWPAESSEARLYDPGALALLLARPRTDVRFLVDPVLHAKVFVVDDEWALIGSGNLTASGLGEKKNLEYGVVVRGLLAGEVGRWIDSIGPGVPAKGALRQLADWKQACEAALQGVSLPPLPRPPGVDSPGNTARDHVEETFVDAVSLHTRFPRSVRTAGR